MFGIISKRFLSKAVSSSPRASSFKPLETPVSGVKRLSPFAVFFTESYKKDPKATVVDTMKNVSAQWKQMSVEEKAKYAEKSKDQYDQKLKEFLKLSTEEQTALVAEAKEKKEEKAARKKIRERREKNRLEERPTVPPNAYALFVKEKLTGTGKANKDKLKEAVAEWKTLGHVDKQKYTDEAKKLMDEYSEQIKKWKLEIKEKANAATSKN